MTPSNPEDSLIMTESTHPYADLITELYQQAIKFQESENFTEALACYQKLINLEPKFLLGYQKIGNLSLKTQEFEQAIHRLKFEELFFLRRDSRLGGFRFSL